jgi:hypothetical protein
MFNILFLRHQCIVLACFATMLRIAPISSAQAQQSSRADETVLRADDLTVTITTSDDRFAGLRMQDKVTGRTLEISDAFTIVLKDKSTLRSAMMSMTAASGSAVGPSQQGMMPTSHNEGQPPRRSCWNFASPEIAAHFQWCAIVRPGTDYVRQQLTISALNQDLPIAEVRLLDLADPAAHVDGTVKGSPVVSGNLFYGFEHPLSTSTVAAGRVTLSLFRDLPLLAGQSVSYSSVLGSSRAGQLRRTFLAYLETERPRPYRPFLHYNSWFDLGYENRFDETGAIDRINAFGQQLTVARNVELDSFLFDDGWDDPNTFWGFNTGFPDGFSKTEAAAAKYKAGIGVWLSPWGGYAEQKEQRIAFGRAHGYEIMNDGYALSGPKYYKRFEATCLEMIDKYNVNQFKFDGTGNAGNVFPGSAFDSDFDAAIHLIERLRQEKPGIFINLTTGTTPSPFWLFYADSIWRGGEDTDFAGEGTSRQRWITYRDGQIYKNIVGGGPLFPLNSLMLHGIVYAKQAKGLSTDPKSEFADEVHSYFGTGTQLQEMYITPSLLSPANWDTLAEAARWSRAHSTTLKDVHWIGGDPARSQVYGWAAWSPHEGIVTLRNPSRRPQEFKLDAAKIFELEEADPGIFAVHSVWSDTARWDKATIRTMRKGQPFSLRLEPFEVITLEAIPTS